MPDRTFTAAQVAAAVIASAATYGDDPALALSGGARSARRAIAPAVVALAAWSGRPLSRVAPLLGACLSHVYALRGEGAPAFERARRAALAALDADDPRAGGELSAAEADVEPLAEAAIDAAPAALLARPARSARPARRPGLRRPSALALKIKPLTPSRLRYARMFLRADWSLEATAQLFDLDPDVLAEAAGR